MPRVGFEPTVSAGERPPTHALDRAATGTGIREGLIYRNRNVERLIFLGVRWGYVCSVGFICTIVWSKEPEKNLKNLIINNV